MSIIANFNMLGRFSDPGFSLCFDNVAIQTTARHQSLESANKVLLLTNTYAVENRVHVRELDEGVTTTASALPLSTFLPSSDDFNCLRNRMGVIVQRILVKIIPCLGDSDDEVMWHIPHEHMAEMSQKSNVVMHYYSILYINAWTVHCQIL